MEKQIKFLKRRFRELDRSNREEGKVNSNDFGNMYNMSRQLERLKSHLSQIKSNRTIIGSNS